MIRSYVILEFCSVYQGKSFGFPPLSCDKAAELGGQFGVENLPGFGEIVFNTSMTGYHEIITDPSYTGQTVLMTYPLIGNYGTDPVWSETGPEQEPDRKSIKASALIVHDYYEGPIPSGRTSLSDFLLSQEIPGITDIDTRKLTLSLRDKGSQNGIIVSVEQNQITPEEIRNVTRLLEESPLMEGQNLISKVGISSCIPLSVKGNLHMGVIDCGIKHTIIRELTSRNVRVTLFPSTVVPEEIENAGIEALLISNGPGDPGVLDHQTKLARYFIGKLPIYGICLGHQLIAQALGAKTYTMKFGHHGGNHPVRDEQTKKVFVTSQNHGFAVDQDSLPEQVFVWFTNANDGSVEGLAHQELPVMSVQFHPEAAPGPHDANWIFDAFIHQAAAFHGKSES
ncbi:MAG: glutamine-hydrolyzing carbamoyl-phosphate synthase small subunit [Spirochaetales bacterium]|nr:glutamine-hydrolyzing carbamoyl-phosphate synthase small subunit [Spirochaetales bacterium]